MDYDNRTRGMKNITYIVEIKGQKIAGPTDRFWALVIDYLFFGAVLILSLIFAFVAISIVNILGRDISEEISQPILSGILIAALLGFFYYYSQMYKSYAQTIGERAMKIKMIPMEDKISLLAGFLRVGFFITPVVGLLSITYLNGSKRQSMLDSLCSAVTGKLHEDQNVK